MTNPESFTFIIGPVLQNEVYCIHMDAEDEDWECYRIIAGISPKKPGGNIRVTLTFKQSREFISRADYYATMSADDYSYAPDLEALVWSYRGIIRQLHKKGYRWDYSAGGIVPVS